MIVRISTEGQYRLASAHLDHLNGIDNRIVDTVAKSDAAGFRELFGQLLTFVRENGERVDENDLATSDVILPPPDTTLDEARNLFVGEGVLPG